MRGIKRALFVATFALFLIPIATQATDTREPVIRTFDTESREMIGEFYSAHPDYRNGGAVAVGDFDGDGDKEIVVVPGPDSPPAVKIFEPNGRVQKEFLAYEAHVRIGMYVAAGDLDGDGIDEIITGARAGGGPHVRVFDGNGNPKFTAGFFAYNENFRGGVRVAVGDVTGNGKMEIITGPANDHAPLVYVFDRYGNKQSVEFQPFADDAKGGVSVAVGDVDNDGVDEIVTAVASKGQSFVKTYEYTVNKTIVGEFMAYPSDHQGGVNLAVGDVDGTGAEEIITAVNAKGGPQFRFWTSSGHELIPNIFAYEEHFRGGIHPAVGDFDGDGRDEIVAAPNNNRNTAHGEKVIEVNLSNQTLYAKEGDRVVRSFKISSGTRLHPSPTGTFTIYRKLPVHLYAGPGYYLPGVQWNLNFLPTYYIHGTYWHSNFGHPMSHGCINMRTSEVGWLYNNFAEVGTQVKIYGTTPAW